MSTPDPARDEAARKAREALAAVQAGGLSPPPRVISPARLPTAQGATPAAPASRPPPSASPPEASRAASGPLRSPMPSSQAPVRPLTVPEFTPAPVLFPPEGTPVAPADLGTSTPHLAGIGGETEPTTFITPVWPEIILETDGWVKIRTKVAPAHARRMGSPFKIVTSEGDLVGRPGDWIIVGEKGDAYPCDDLRFREHYEPATVHHHEVVDPVQLDPASRAEVEHLLREMARMATELAHVTRKGHELLIQRTPTVHPTYKCSDPDCQEIIVGELADIEAHYAQKHPLPEIPPGVAR